MNDYSSPGLGTHGCRAVPRRLLLVVLLLVASTSIMRSQAPPSEDEPHRRLLLVEERQKIAIEGMDKTYRNGFWFLSLVAGITALFGVFRQFEDRKLLKYPRLAIQHGNEERKRLLFRERPSATLTPNSGTGNSG